MHLKHSTGKCVLQGGSGDPVSKIIARCGRHVLLSFTVKYCQLLSHTVTDNHLFRTDAINQLVVFGKSLKRRACKADRRLRILLSRINLLKCLFFKNGPVWYCRTGPFLGVWLIINHPIKAIAFPLYPIADIYVLAKERSTTNLPTILSRYAERHGIFPLHP